jgi:hypothetical protein
MRMRKIISNMTNSPRNKYPTMQDAGKVRVGIKAHDTAVILSGEPSWFMAVPCNVTFLHD